MRGAPPPKRQQIFLILVMAAMLVGILVMRDQCGRGAAGLFKAIDAPAARDGGPPRG
jgi:hypothetical protein